MISYLLNLMLDSEDTARDEEISLKAKANETNVVLRRQAQRSLRQRPDNEVGHRRARLDRRPPSAGTVPRFFSALAIRWSW